MKLILNKKLQAEIKKEVEKKINKKLYSEEETDLLYDKITRNLAKEKPELFDETNPIEAIYLTN